MTDTTSNCDPRIDAYIAHAAAFARPILTRLREVVHAGCPDVQETVKWGAPSFEHHGLLCGMAAFKQHCVFGFWKHELVVGADRAAAPSQAKQAKQATGGTARGKNTSRRSTPGGVRGSDKPSGDAMGNFGRLTRVADLPARSVLVALVRKAAKLNEDGVKAPRPAPRPKVDLVVPADLAAGLKKSPAAKTHFDGFSYSKRKDYIEWLTDARTPETRARRLATALEWIADGKGRNWKYERC